MSPVLFLKRPTAWLEAISQYRGTVSFAPNFAYELCLRRVKPSQIEALDLSSWRVAGCGAEPIRARHAAGFRRPLRVERVPRLELRPELWPGRTLAGGSRWRATAWWSTGSTRPGSAANRSPFRRSMARPPIRIVGCGAAFPGHDIQIMDDEG